MNKYIFQDIFNELDYDEQHEIHKIVIYNDLFGGVLHLYTFKTPSSEENERIN